jgi:hypothetical protein
MALQTRICINMRAMTIHSKISAGRLRRSSEAAGSKMQSAGEAGESGADACAPVFIVGCGRSGTTLLRLILNGHRDLAVFGETATFFRVGKYDTLDHERSFARFIRDWRTICRAESPYPDLMEDDSLRRALRLAPSYAAATSAIMREFAKREGKPVWGEKTPAHVHKLPLILQAYPNARIIHITRDPRAVTSSSLTNFPGGRFDLYSAYENAVYWTRCESAIERFSPLAPNQIAKLKYEDLVADPQSAARSLCAFLNVDFHQEMLETAGTALRYGPKQEDGTLMAHHRSLAERVNAEPVGKWRKTLTEEMVHIVQHVAEEWMRKRGYSLEDVSGPRRSGFRELVLAAKYSIDRTKQVSHRLMLHGYWRGRILLERLS